VIFFDFDRTLCVTKGGCLPDPGKHRPMDSEILKVLRATLARSKGCAASGGTGGGDCCSVDGRGGGNGGEGGGEGEGGGPVSAFPSAAVAAGTEIPLSSLCACVGACVVTRNPHAEAIAAWLAFHGCGGCPVASVTAGRKRHKAAARAEGGASGGESSGGPSGGAGGPSGGSHGVEGSGSGGGSGGASGGGSGGGGSRCSSGGGFGAQSKVDVILGALRRGHGACDKELGGAMRSAAVAAAALGLSGAALGSSVDDELPAAPLVGLFVDDSVAEVADAALAAWPRLHRVRFGRA